MTKIVLANIGNRNIKYRGDFITEYLKQHNSSENFYTFSQQLFENFENEKEFLEISILDTLLDKTGDNVKQVYLFSSNQPHNTRKDQDTYYAGEMLRFLIPLQYGHIKQVENLQIKCSVVEPNSLLKTYKKSLKSIDFVKGTDKIVVCDSGGTAQQKSSLKIMMEFLFDEDDFEVHYIAKDKRIQWMEVPQIEYRNIIEAEQVLSLIAYGEYEAAFQLKTGFNQTHLYKKDNFLFKFAALRISAMFKEAELLTKSLQQNKPARIKDVDFIQSFLQKQSYIINKDIENEKLTGELFEFNEHLIASQFYYHIGNYTQFVLKLSFAFEELINVLISHYTPYNLGKHYQKQGNKLIEEINTKEKWKKVKATANHRFSTSYNDNLRLSFPVLLEFTEEIIKDKIHGCMDIIELFYPKARDRQNLGLANLRNKVAHKGEGVTENKLHKEFKIDRQSVTKLYEYFGLPEKSPYTEFNEHISALLK